MHYYALGLLGELVLVDRRRVDVGQTLAGRNVNRNGYALFSILCLGSIRVAQRGGPPRPAHRIPPRRRLHFPHIQRRLVDHRPQRSLGSDANSIHRVESNVVFCQRPWPKEQCEEATPHLPSPGWLSSWQHPDR